jgi:hypothetical protein
MKTKKMLEMVVTQFPRWAGVSLPGPSRRPAGDWQNYVYSGAY